VIFAIADPPYPGQAAKHYKNHADYGGEVDHEELIGYLVQYDGWALSTSSPALRDVLQMCPAGVRVGAWVKPFASFKPGVNPAYAWEPVVFSGGRKRERSEPTVRDWHSESITLKKGLAGVKPEGFCFWMFDLLGMEPGDVLRDMFPGSGAISQAWEKYTAIREGRPIQGALL
jgi:hypothetical protein